VAFFLKWYLASLIFLSLQYGAILISALLMGPCLAGVLFGIAVVTRLGSIPYSANAALSERFTGYDARMASCGWNLSYSYFSRTQLLPVRNRSAGFALTVTAVLSGYLFSTCHCRFDGQFSLTRNKCGGRNGA